METFFPFHVTLIFSHALAMAHGLPMKISAVKTAYAILVLTGTVYAFVALQGSGGIPGLLEKRRLVHEYEVTNQQLHREIEQKQQRLLRLRENPAEQEMEIRQKLKLARPGEKIYILDQKKESPRS